MNIAFPFPWQILLILFFIFSTTHYLLRRVLAQKLGGYNRLINSVFFVFFLLPAAIILFFLFPGDLNVGALNLFLLLGGSIIWPISNIVAFHANKKVDVGIFTIINNLSPLFTLMIAIPFLHENITSWQNIGMGLLILSGVLASSSQLNKHNRSSFKGILFCILSAAIMGIGIAYESYMLSRVDFGAYFIYGWGAQIAWMAILTGKELKKLPTLFTIDKRTTNTLLIWGASKVLGSVCFILALKISASASIISSATNFQTVLIVLVAWFFLNEHQHMIYKILASIIGITGLLFITK